MVDAVLENKKCLKQDEIENVAIPLKGHGRDVSQISFSYFYCLQYFSKYAFLMIIQIEELLARYRAHDSSLWK